MGSSGSTEQNIEESSPCEFDVHYRYSDLRGDEKERIYPESQEDLIRALAICVLYLDNGYPAYVMRGDEKFSLESVWLTNYTFVDRYYKKYIVDLAQLDFLKEEIFPEPSTSNL